jgi:hypothetical protein
MAMPGLRLIQRLTPRQHRLQQVERNPSGVGRG